MVWFGGVCFVAVLSKQLTKLWDTIDFVFLVAEIDSESKAMDNIDAVRFFTQKLDKTV
jgi:hypothetical protein